MIALFSVCEQSALNCVCYSAGLVGCIAGRGAKANATSLEPDTGSVISDGL